MAIAEFEGQVPGGMAKVAIFLEPFPLWGVNIR
jgi:hypothetical protein